MLQILFRSWIVVSIICGLLITGNILGGQIMLMTVFIIWGGVALLILNILVLVLFRQIKSNIEK